MEEKKWNPHYVICFDEKHIVKVEKKETADLLCEILQSQGHTVSILRAV